MKRLLGGFLLVLLLLAAAAAALLDPEPLVTREAGLSPAAVAQARQLLAAHDPRRLRPGQRGTALIPVSLLDAGAGHLASRYLKARASVGLGADGLELRISRPVLGGARYLNLEAIITAPQGSPRLARARLGALPLPAGLATAGADRIAGLAGYDREWQLARQALRRVLFQPEAGRVAVAYVWEPELLTRARAIALPAGDLERLRDAQGQLAALLAGRQDGASAPLLAILQPLLPAAGADRRQRRRAGLLVLAFHLTGRDLTSLAPEAGRWPRPRRIELTLGGRLDLAQHFVASAALAAWADEPVADAIGLYKELQDAHRGSGFSFADLAADRAGSRFGELLARDDERLDQALAAPLSDGQLLPSLEGLPEFLREPEFRRRYGGPDSPAYRQLQQDIEARLDALSLYR